MSYIHHFTGRSYTSMRTIMDAMYALKMEKDAIQRSLDVIICTASQYDNLMRECCTTAFCPDTFCGVPVEVYHQWTEAYSRAFTLSQSGKKVIFIDHECDRPSWFAATKKNGGAA